MSQRLRERRVEGVGGLSYPRLILRAIAQRAANGFTGSRVLALLRAIGRIESPRRTAVAWEPEYAEP